MPRGVASSHCGFSVFRFFGDLSFDLWLEIRCSSFPWTLKILILTVVAMNRGLFLHFPLSIWLLTSRFEAALDIGWESSCCLITKLCLTLWNPMDCSLPGSSVHGLLEEKEMLNWCCSEFFFLPLFFDSHTAALSRFCSVYLERKGIVYLICLTPIGPLLCFESLYSEFTLFIR